MRELQQMDYIAEPHTAIAYASLTETLKPDEYGAFISTAHPAKFIETVEQILNIEMPLPKALLKVQDLEILSKTITNDTSNFNKILLK